MGSVPDNERLFEATNSCSTDLNLKASQTRRRCRDTNQVHYRLAARPFMTVCARVCWRRWPIPADGHCGADPGAVFTNPRWL